MNLNFDEATCRQPVARWWRVTSGCTYSATTRPMEASITGPGSLRVGLPPFTDLAAYGLDTVGNCRIRRSTDRP